MPVSIHQGKGWPVRTVEVSGHFTALEVIHTVEDLLSGNDFDPETPALWDLRGVPPEGPALTTEEVRTIAHGVGRLWAKRSRSRVAFVAPRGVDYGLARVCAALLDRDAPDRLRVFRSYEEARTWLAQSEPLSIPLTLESPGVTLRGGPPMGLPLSLAAPERKWRRRRPGRGSRQRL